MKHVWSDFVIHADLSHEERRDQPDQDQGDGEGLREKVPLSPQKGSCCSVRRRIDRDTATGPVHLYRLDNLNEAFYYNDCSYFIISLEA